MSSPSPARPIRREPPQFGLVHVHGVAPLSARMVRVTLVGPVLGALAVTEPAASVRLLLPPPGASTVMMPAWNGNEFLLPGGRRPLIRTFTPRRARPTSHELDLDIVVHGSGPASDWAAGARAGDEAALSGPGRGTVIDPSVSSFVLLGDETAIPAISQMLEVLSPATSVAVHLEVGAPGAPVALPEHPGARTSWSVLGAGQVPGDTLVAAARAAPLAPGAHVWAAGEAAAMQRIRRHLFEERGVSRSHTTIRGYWKHGRAGAGAEA